jgi:chemotaxis signal transduction protein
MIYLLQDEPSLFEIPQSPCYCRNVFVWQGGILPLMDLPLRLLGRRTVNQGFLAIVAFRKYPGAKIEHGALLLSSPPTRIGVNDTQACDLPETPPDWRRLAIACFERAGQGAVPVLDLSKVFSLAPGDASGRNLTEAQ